MESAASVRQSLIPLPLITASGQELLGVDDERLRQAAVDQSLQL